MDDSYTNTINSSRLPPGMKLCPFCRATVRKEAVKCDSCGFDPSNWNPGVVPEMKQETGRKVSTLLLAIIAIAIVAVLGVVIVKWKLVASKPEPDRSNPVAVTNQSR